MNRVGVLQERGQACQRRATGGLSAQQTRAETPKSSINGERAALHTEGPPQRDPLTPTTGAPRPNWRYHKSLTLLGIVLTRPHRKQEPEFRTSKHDAACCPALLCAGRCTQNLPKELFLSLLLLPMAAGAQRPRGGAGHGQAPHALRRVRHRGGADLPSRPMKAPLSCRCLLRRGHDALRYRETDQELNRDEKTCEEKPRAAVKKGLMSERTRFEPASMFMLFAACPWRPLGCGDHTCVILI